MLILCMEDRQDLYGGAIVGDATGRGFEAIHTKLEVS